MTPPFITFLVCLFVLISPFIVMGVMSACVGGLFGALIKQEHNKQKKERFKGLPNTDDIAEMIDELDKMTEELERKR